MLKKRSILSMLLLVVLTLLFNSAKASETDNQTQEYSREILNESRIAVLMGSTADTYATKNSPGATLVRVESIADLYLMVEAGHADYAIIDMPIIENLIREGCNIKVVEDEFERIGVAVAIPSDQSAMKTQFDNFLAEFRETTTYKEMFKRWFEDGDTENIPVVETNSSGKTLVVATDPNNFPGSTIVNKELTGFEIELIKHYTLKEGYQVKFMQMNFGSLIAAVSAGKADIGVCSICVTEERKKKFLFSDEYTSVALGVFCKDESKQVKYIDFKHPTEITALVAGEQITADDTIRCYIGDGITSVVEGTIHEQYMSSRYPASQVSIAKEYPDALLTLVANKSDFILTNYGTARSFKKSQESVEIVLSDIYPYNTCYGINKDNLALLEEIDQFLTRKRADGTLDKLYDKWMDKLDDSEMESLDFDPNGKVLRVGSSCTAMPFNFLSNGKPAGLDLEVLVLFCKDAGYKLELIEMPFGALISSIVTGKVDVIANTLSPTKERREKINFSLPYGHNSFALLANRELSDMATTEDNVGIFESIKRSFVSNIITEDRYELILEGIGVTTIISILSIILGTILGSIICMMKLSRSAISRSISKVYIDIVRGTPVLVILMINFYVVFAKVPISPVLVATISFAMNFAAYVSEMFGSTIKSIDKGQTEAGLAMGFTKTKTFLLIIAPQAIKRVLPVYKGESISLIKMTSVVGYIAVQDITKVGDIIRSRTFDAFFPLLVSALLYFLLAYLFSVILDLSTSKIIRKNDNNK